MAQAVFPDDVLPSEGVYDSRASLLAAINSWAKPRGYAFTTGKSSKTPNGRVKVVFACDRNKPPPSTLIERKRRTCSRGTGCEFSVLAKESLDGASWVLSHRQGQQYVLHNHPPSEDPSAHPSHRQLSEKDIQDISNLTASGAAPREIRTYLHNNSNTLATQKDVYNQIGAARRDLREGQSSIQALVNRLHEEGFWCQIRLDSDNRVTAIFFAHPDSIAYLQCNPDVLLLDCTYKTNKHSMPLLDMVGVDACERSFCVAFAFLSGETEDDYLWALQHLRSLYQRDLPSVVLTDRCQAAINAAATSFPLSKGLLCTWHVNKAVLQHCRPAFLTDKNQGEKRWDEFYAFWHSIVASPNETIFQERLTSFERKYAKNYTEAVGYIRTTWLDPFKERIVRAWVDKHLHFGNVATSRQVAYGMIEDGVTNSSPRAEGIHSLIKAHIKISTLDLFDVWQAMRPAVTNQLKELKYMRASQQVSMPLDVSGVLFEAVRGWVSHKALRKVLEQRQLLSKPLKAACTKTFTSSFGLPCVHTLKRLEEEGRTLSLQHFHPHWHLKRDVSQPQPMLEPRAVSSQFNRRRNRSVTSTRREPSAFEAIQETMRPKAQPTCSRCHALGHIMTSKACPLRYEELFQVSEQATEVAAQITQTISAATVAPAATETTSVQAAVGQVEADLTTAVQVLAGHTGEGQIETVQELDGLVDHAAASQTSTIEEVADCIVVVQTVADQVAAAETMAAPELRYDDPRAIHHRYVEARQAWYNAQPRGSIKTNQQYRKAMGLPQRYDKVSYKWCLDWKQMGKQRMMQRGPREWTKEEMMAYLDWSRAEEVRVEALVAAEMEGEPFSNRRGMREIWEAAAADCDAQQALYLGQ
ncbi:mutator-like element transposase [Pochonia chlamydosporia 170]|uniref:Mutator-like element transposase n=1 Tax=Pochonia chlamydosporia 170 TaxID=1380566 RepID=A0A179F650_METCM|nr:mutator-like element transposase [Pochonia chlamydosporia 170]XP_018141524.1 mutator-like element transposase [Pochonia chlamydosporia 170]OAQ60872.1 mutator-like element transposase [Pochonia chlamydosporia 170]OAQ64210.1 mutator-like element transposase [Pochonia chlamydosporia 170]